MSHFKLQTAFALALVAGALPMADVARAADLDPGYADVPAPITQQQLTFGSGWYVRGDLGANYGLGVEASTPSLGSAPELTVGQKKDISYTASLGAGYQFTNYFRADAVFDFHQPINSTQSGNKFTCDSGVYGTPVGATSFTGRAFVTDKCSSTLQAKIQNYDILLNGYFDLGNYYGFTPYVGAGIGMSFGHYQTSAKYFYSNGNSYDFIFTDPVSSTTFERYYDQTSSGNYYNVAWALMAGVSYDVYAHTKLDLSYRYLNLGRVLGTTVSTNQVRAGLRYMIDN